MPAGIHVQRVAPFCPLLLALPRTCCCKQAAGQAPAAAWCCRTMLALAWRSRRRRCSWHNCSCRSSLTRAHVRVCAGCKWRALIGYAAWDPARPCTLPGRRDRALDSGWEILLDGSWTCTIDGEGDDEGTSFKVEGALSVMLKVYLRRISPGFRRSMHARCRICGRCKARCAVGHEWECWIGPQRA